MSGETSNGRTGICACCSRPDSDMREGFCFDCATIGERRALRRTVAQHVGWFARHALKFQWSSARIDLAWAWERLTRTGDYAPGGYAEQEIGRVR